MGTTSTVADFIVGDSVGDAIAAFPPGATVVSIDDGSFAWAAGASRRAQRSATATVRNVRTRRSYSGRAGSCSVR